MMMMMMMMMMIGSTDQISIFSIGEDTNTSDDVVLTKLYFSS
jgi:hypothetical protein